MSFRTTVVLFAVAVALTTYAVIFEQSRLSGFEGPGKVYPDLEPSDILRLSIEYRGEDAESRSGSLSSKIVVKRRGEHEWWLEEPLEFPGLLPRIEGLTWAIVDLVQIDRISPDAEAYASAVPEDGADITVRFWTRQGAEHAIEIGRDYPERSVNHLYIRVDSADVHVTSKRFRETFSVGVSDLRSRALFPVAYPDAVYLSVRAADGAGKKLAKKLIRAGETAPWRFAEDPELQGTLAERRKVEELLVELNSWTIDSFESDSAEDLNRYGLRSPAFHVVGKHRDGRETSLEIGAEFQREGQDLVYVRHSGQPFVFVADASPLAYLRTDPQELRTRHVFDFQGVEIQRIACRGRTSSFTLERKPAREGDGRPEGRREAAKSGDARSAGSAEYVWIVRDASGEEQSADRHLVGVALAEVRELLIQEFLRPLPDGADASSFDRSVTVTLETGEEYVLRLGKRSEHPRDKDLSVYHALRSTDRSHFLVETGWAERIELGAHVFHDRRISRLNPAGVYEVEVAAGASRWRVGRVKDRWMLPAGQRLLPGKELDPGPLNGLLRALDRDTFRVAKFAPEVPREDYEFRGIGRRAFRLALFLTNLEEGAAGFRRLYIGHRMPEADPELYYARADSCDVPFLVSGEVADLLQRVVDHLRDITGEP